MAKATLVMETNYKSSMSHCKKQINLLILKTKMFNLKIRNQKSTENLKFKINVAFYEVNI